MPCPPRCPSPLPSLFLLGGLCLSAPADAQQVEQIVDNMGDRVAMGGGGGGATVPDYYTVQTGDTLWEISSAFLGNAFYWPRLWSINDYITNPHWIYPGNRIVFRMGTLLDPPSVELETMSAGGGYVDAQSDYSTSDAECGPNVRFNQTRDARTYIAPGFLAQKDDLEVYGTVPKARGLQSMLSERDLIYLKVDDPDAFQCGDVVTVFRRVSKKVRHPETKEKYGSLYRIVAEAKIVHQEGKYVSAVLRQSWSEVERGDLVGPMLPVAVQIEVAEPKGDVVATLVARTNEESFSMAPGETVFIDRGREDGVRVGSSFYIYERRDEMLDIKREDDKLPLSVIGRLVVVRVDERTSTAVITDADRSLTVGNHLTQKLSTD